MKRKWRLAPLKMVTQRYTIASRKLIPRAHPETTPMIHTWNPRSWREHVTVSSCLSNELSNYSTDGADTALQLKQSCCKLYTRRAVYCNATEGRADVRG